jgi:GAF domain-containing protein
MPTSQRRWLARPVKLGRRAATVLRPTAAAEDPVRTPDADLRGRVERLEAMLEDLQDALYRQCKRDDERIADLQRQLEPRTIARALSEDARHRGL